MSDDSASRRTGIGFTGALTILFVGLKLAEVGTVATWSWWWVLSPLWISTALVAVLTCAYLLLVWRDDRRRRNALVRRMAAFSEALRNERGRLR